MSDVGVSATGQEFEDRRTGLIVFGALICVAGALVGLLVPLMLLGALMGAASAGLSVSMALPGILIYAVLAVMLVTLGVGSIMCKRWARAFILIFSSMSIVTGVMLVAWSSFMMPKMLAATPSVGNVPPGVMALMSGFVTAIYMLILVVIPGVLIFFYRSPHVKATCEIRNPSPNWTDTLPLPRLALTTILAFSALSFPGLIFSYGGVIPFFGMFLDGILCVLIAILLSAAYAYCAYLTYRGKMLGWTLAVALYSASSLSYIITTATVGLSRIYQAMGLPHHMLDMYEKMGLMDGSQMALLGILGSLPWIGFLIYSRRYFEQK